MIRILESKQIGRLFARRAVRLGEAEAVVRPILDDVRKRGDRALIEYARRFDGFDRATNRRINRMNRPEDFHPDCGSIIDTA